MDWGRGRQRIGETKSIPMMQWRLALESTWYYDVVIFFMFVYAGSLGCQRV